MRLWDAAGGGASKAALRLTETLPGCNVTGLAKAVPSEPTARLYASTSSGAVVALGISADAAEMDVLAVGGGESQ